MATKSPTTAAKKASGKAVTPKKATTKKPAKPSKPVAKKITVIGRLTNEGVECQAMREDKTRKLFTLVPPAKLKGFKNGEHVLVNGTIVDISFCQQGTTVSIQSIRRVI